MKDEPSGSAGQLDRISRFTIVELLGEGAMGVVYRARDTLLGREVALKLIKPELAGERKNRARFLRECRAAATINHPGVATIYEAGETEDGLLFLASELVEGETLKDRVARGAVDPTEVVEVGIQLCEALQAAHRRGAIHRDVKPSNLMVDGDGRLKVLDFGLARLMGGEDSEDLDGPPIEGRRAAVDMTQQGAVVGTPAYMSPEQAAGLAVDARTDVFSAGCVLYELVTGHSPFHAGSVSETLRRVLCDEPPAIESPADDALPEGLEEVLRGALTKDREQRTATAGEVASALRELAERPGGTAGPRRRTVLVGGVVGAVLIATVAILVWQWSRPGLAFTSSDRLLVADVDNHTDDDTFDLALRTALETDLKQSPFASVFETQQIQRTLRLMRRPADSFVDETLGRDICRFSGIRAMVVPRIARSGDAYELEAAIVDPMTGRRVERIRVTAPGRAEVLLDAVDQLSHEVRARLGETLESIDEADYPISDVTTSSWEAMHHFALGTQEWARGNFDDAARLYQLAVDIDPDFATCRGSLGLLLIQFLDQPERGREELRRALTDGETLPRDEYLMLRAANRQFVDGDLEGALAEYELISAIYPNDMASYNNRGRILTTLGRYDEAAEMFEKAAAIDRQASIPLINLAFLHASRVPDAVAAENACRRLVGIDPEIANYHSLLGWMLAVQGRYDEAKESLERALELEPDHAYALPNLGYTLLAMGNPESAVLQLRRHLGRVREQGGGRGAVVDLLVALDAAGRQEEAREAAEQARAAFLVDMAGADWTIEDHVHLAQVCALAGRRDEAEAQLERARRLEPDDADGLMELACGCAVLGDRICAIRNTGLALDRGFGDPFLPMLMPVMHSLLGDPEFMALFPIDGSSSEF